MPLDTTTSPRTSIRGPQVVFAPNPDTTGTLTINPVFAELFARVGLASAAGFFELPGEVVSGHADRHVMRVEVPGAPRAFYLKRQHVVGWREKWRNSRAGFGWASRCAREAELLRQLEAAKLPAPRWAVVGTHGNRAFLLVEEIPDAVDLRRVLSDNALSRVQRSALATRLGETIAAVHAAGFSSPDLTAKHVLVNPDTLAITFLDWQSAERGASVSEPERTNALGALHASLAEPLASPTERVRVLRAYRASSLPAQQRAACVLRAAARHAKRRSIRDQLQPEGASQKQRLVWLAGEAVCAIPEIAAEWPKPAVAPPFYCPGANDAIALRVLGYDATLVRGYTSAPVGRFRAWARAAPWRAPGVTIGRVLFHLQRYGVPGPRLLAFGQRLTSAIGAEWFALYESPPGMPLQKWRYTASFAARRAALDRVADCLAKLHAAGCVLTDPQAAFSVHDGAACVTDPRAVRIVRRVRTSARRRDLRDAARLLGVE
ncbi:heptose kinase : : Kdo [Gemmata massiliana]|uniref:Heptose kinase:: Kdo n=1 Tax=Gemmata massiliana TaxID=1210884 RepID=A0A6P2D7E2_9BACT|nr:lipopolysaccharide kinase InaA family protein [Gemmata massiliana]VTR97251.1 heptose kinase : : Kdo [Gemmata massiliana]